MLDTYEGRNPFSEEFWRVFRQLQEEWDEGEDRRLALDKLLKYPLNEEEFDSEVQGPFLATLGPRTLIQAPDPPPGGEPIMRWLYEFEEARINTSYAVVELEGGITGECINLVELGHTFFLAAHGVSHIDTAEYTVDVLAIPENTPVVMHLALGENDPDVYYFSEVNGLQVECIKGGG